MWRIHAFGGLLAGLVALGGPAMAAPAAAAPGALVLCLPLDGHAGQIGCDPTAPLAAAGAQGSFAAGVRPAPGPARSAVPSVAAPEGDEDAPAGGLVALASVAAVLSLSLRRAAA